MRSHAKANQDGTPHFSCIAQMNSWLLPKYRDSEIGFEHNQVHSLPAMGNEGSVLDIGGNRYLEFGEYKVSYNFGRLGSQASGDQC